MRGRGDRRGTELRGGEGREVHGVGDLRRPDRDVERDQRVRPGVLKQRQGPLARIPTGHDEFPVAARGRGVVCVHGAQASIFVESRQ